jgi:8-oxo-dGTP pyrophosphatase MutT (NUDIX family)
MINELKNILSNRLKAPLPGIQAHLEVAPYRKVDYTPEQLKNAKQSGVLILFYEKLDGIYAVMIERAINNGKHSGQIAFPGGKKEVDDANLIETALRETEEEVGVIKNHIEIIGSLSDVYIPVSNYRVLPSVGVISYQPSFILQEEEVKSVLEVNINEIIHPQALSSERITLSNGTKILAPCFNLNNQIVWGATALMVNELRHLLK